MKFPELRQLKDNTVYMLRNWYKWHRRSFLYLAARIPALVAVPMLMAYAPKVIMDCVTAHVPVSTLVLRVALLSAGIAAANSDIRRRGADVCGKNNAEGPGGAEKGGRHL